MHVPRFLCTFICLVCFSHQLPSIAQPNSPTPDQQSKGKEHNSAPKGISSKNHDSEQATNSQNAKPEDIPEKRLYHRYLRATILGVCVSILLLLALIYQNKLTRQTARAAQASADAVIASQRAWVMAEMEWTPMYSGISEGNNGSGPVTSMVNVRLHYRNDGNTPAWVDEIKACFEIIDSPSQQPNTERMELVQAGPVPLTVDGKECVDLALKSGTRQGFGKMNVVYGVIYYRDAFKQKCRTFFGYKIIERQILYLDGYPEYNKNT